MKSQTSTNTKLGTCILFFVLTLTSRLFAQVPNGDFESLNFDGSLRNWGNVYLMPVSIDSNGVNTHDSIVWGSSYFYGPTTDAHSGFTALELSNALNYTTGQSITGAASVDTDSVYSAYGSLEFIPTQTHITDWNFYYKYFPAGYDSAQAMLVVYDSWMTEIGSANITLGGLTSNYTYTSAQVVYTSPGTTVEYYSIHFRATAYGQNPTFGTRLIIDDVTINGTTSIADNEMASLQNIFPNPAQNEIHLEPLAFNSEMRIYSATGKLIRSYSLTAGEKNISLEKIENGIYFLEQICNGNSRRAKFLVAK